MKKIFPILLVLCSVACSALSSCSDRDDYYWSPLCGSWQLNSVNGYLVSEEDVSEFVFNPDGTGTYGQYNPFPRWNVYQISWDTDFPGDFDNMLYIDTWDGQTWVYNYTVGYGQLQLRDTFTGDVLIYTPY